MKRRGGADLRSFLPSAGWIQRELALALKVDELPIERSCHDHCVIEREEVDIRQRGAVVGVGSSRPVGPHELDELELWDVRRWEQAGGHDPNLRVVRRITTTGCERNVLAGLGQLTVIPLQVRLVAPAGSGSSMLGRRESRAPDGTLHSG
jgi:hypothetical protein